jgi:protein-L-isoaspartate(D-aspartate) O-methyltransferase
MTADLAIARANMLESQVRTADVTDVAIQDAIGAAPRESLCPAGKAYLAYSDAEVEYADGRWLLKPRDIAKLLQALKPRSGETALAISAPYAALVLAQMGLQVTEADAGAQPVGAFDVVVVEGAVTSAPAAWTEALAGGGRLGVVERSGPVGRAVVYLRTDEGVGRREMFDSTPPYLAGFAPQPGFTF